MENIKRIKLEDIAEKLERIELLPTETVSLKAKSELIPPQALLEEAAVMVFFDPELWSLNRSNTSSPLFNNDIALLIGVSELVIGNSNEAVIGDNRDINGYKNRQIKYILRSDLRSTTLAKLTSEGRVRKTLDLNPNITFDPNFLLQRVFTSYLLDELPSLKEMGIDMLNALQRISEWLGSTFRYSLDELKRHIERAEMLKPFKHLTGKYVNGKFIEYFRGRKSELVALRKYVGVAAPQSALESVERFFQSRIELVFNFLKKPPLLIFGLGGAGKSTLLAKFILEHAEAAIEDQFPFVYLDFDRPVLSPVEPETLLIEAARQLSVQFPNKKVNSSFSDFYIQWKSREVSGPENDSLRIKINDNHSALMLRAEREEIIKQFAGMIHELSDNNKPFLMILDTFEEVQYKGSEAVSQLYQFMEQIQSSYPALRVVVAGRSPITQLKTNEMELGELDAEAAAGFLEMSGITDKQLKQLINSSCGLIC